jgi:hypothetical protein
MGSARRGEERSCLCAFRCGCGCMADAMRARDDGVDGQWGREHGRAQVRRTRCTGADMGTGARARAGIPCVRCAHGGAGAQVRGRACGGGCTGTERPRGEAAEMRVHVHVGTVAQVGVCSEGGGGQGTWMCMAAMRGRKRAAVIKRGARSTADGARDARRAPAVVCGLQTEWGDTGSAAEAGGVQAAERKPNVECEALRYARARTSRIQGLVQPVQVRCKRDLGRTSGGVQSVAHL